MDRPPRGFHLMQKLGTRSLAGLTKFAIREGVTLLEE